MSTVSSSPIAACLSLTRAISRADSPDDIYTAALDALAQALTVTRAAVLLFDPDGVMRFKAWRGLSSDVPRRRRGPLAVDARHAGRTADRRRRRRQGPVARRAIERRSPPRASRALAFIPLVSAGRVIGKFMLYYDAPRTLTDEERQLAEVIAAQVAFALARTQSRRRASRVNDERLRFALEAAAHGHLGAGSRAHGS